MLLRPGRWVPAQFSDADGRRPWSCTCTDAVTRLLVSHADYIAAVDALMRARARPDPSFRWCYMRLQPRLGTVEVRVMDAQSRIADVAPLVASIQLLARLELEDQVSASTPGAEAVGPESVPWRRASDRGSARRAAGAIREHQYHYDGRSSLCAAGSHTPVHPS